MVRTHSVYNYWEPVHLLAATHALRTNPIPAFQTWEYAPQFAIRSWAYILLHAIPTALATRVLQGPFAFYVLRMVLAAASAAADATLYRSAVQAVNARVGRYLLIFLLTSAGTTMASVALLPSSFVMYTSSLGMAYALSRASVRNQRRAFGATLAFALGALGGWPYALLLSLPFVYEELFMYGTDAVPATETRPWILRRWSRAILAVVTASLLAIPIVSVDSLAYGHATLVALNTVLYNVLGHARGISPELYGTEPWTYYPVNLLLNLGVVFPLALLSLPAVLMTAHRTPARFTGDFPGTKTPRKSGAIHAPGSDPSVLLALRVLPVYIWIGVLSLQAHKEERFLYPVYPLMCMNAAITLYIGRAWIEAAYLRLTRSPYRASRTWLFPLCTLTPLVLAAVTGCLRLVGLVQHYHAPMDVLQALPNSTATLCYGKEWHRFPSHFFVPPNVHVQFIPSDFHGILPAHFVDGPVDELSNLVWPWAGATRRHLDNVNELNQEEPDRYVDIATCDYLVDVHFPARNPTPREPNYAESEAWTKVSCVPFLDAEGSREAARGSSLGRRVLATLARTLWLPGTLTRHIPRWEETLRYGDYCLLQHAPPHDID